MFSITMDGHVDTCLWFYGLLTVMIFYIVCNVICELMELWTFEYNNDNVCEILIINENYTEVIIIYCDDTDIA